MAWVTPAVNTKLLQRYFLYKFLNDKFLHEIRKVDDNLKNAENIEETLTNMDDDEYEFLLASLPPATAQLKKEHFISFLFNNKTERSLMNCLTKHLWISQISI